MCPFEPSQHTFSSLVPSANLIRNELFQNSFPEDSADSPPVSPDPSGDRVTSAHLSSDSRGPSGRQCDTHGRRTHIRTLLVRVYRSHRQVRTAHNSRHFVSGRLAKSCDIRHATNSGALMASEDESPGLPTYDSEVILETNGFGARCDSAGSRVHTSAAC